MYDACGNGLMSKKRGSVERIEPPTTTNEPKLKPILKKRDSSLAGPRSGMVKSHSLDINEARADEAMYTAPQRKSESMKRFNQSREMLRPFSAMTTDRPVSPHGRHSSPESITVTLPHPLTRKGSVRKGRQETSDVPKKGGKKAKKKRSDREVVMTNETIHEQEDTLDNLIKPKSFMKKMFFM